MIHFNTLVKNEEILLDNILPIWKTYDVDEYVFFDDNSSDKSLEVIKSHIPEKKIKIFRAESTDFNESKFRQTMLTYSRDSKAEYIASIDCDELLSANLAKNLKENLKHFDFHNMYLYWFNLADTIEHVRIDGYYENAYHLFVAHTKNLKDLDLTNSNYHSSWRILPNGNFPPVVTSDIGVIHLQSLNKKFYALKQLWYKHHEYINYGYSPETINKRYDKNVNYLNFKTLKCPEEIVEGILINPSIFENILEQKKYKNFILENYKEELITFGKEYLI